MPLKLIKSSILKNRQFSALQILQDPFDLRFIYILQLIIFSYKKNVLMSFFSFVNIFLCHQLKKH